MWLPPDFFCINLNGTHIMYSHTITKMLICVNQYLVSYQVVSCLKHTHGYFNKHIVLETLFKSTHSYTRRTFSLIRMQLFVLF